MRSNLHVRFSPRRGMAMLLVIISLMMATILTTAYLSSRDNSILIGSNATGGAAARSAALTGLDLAGTIMQTKTNWRTSDPHGFLISAMPANGGSVSVQAIDELTQQPPTATSEYFTILSMAVVDGVEEVATARVYAPRHSGNTVDVDLSEFAIFVSNRLDMSNRATVTRWSKSPLTSNLDRVAIGTRAGSAASIVLADTSGVIDGTVFIPPGSSSSLVTGGTAFGLKSVQVTDLIPVPAAPNVGVAATALPSPLDSTVNGGSSLITANARYRDLEVKSNGVRTFQGNLRIVTERDLKINSGGKIVINGNVRMAVFGNMIVDQGAIELGPTGTLSLFVRGDSSTSMSIKDGYIGDNRTDNTRDSSGGAVYFDPTRLSIYSIPPTGNAPDWQIERNSVIKGSIYAPDVAKVKIQNQSALYGRVATRAVELKDDAAIFYDPLLNSRLGYTAENSRLFAEDGTIQSAYKTLASLDASSLQAVADLYSAIIKGLSSTSSDVSPTTPPPDTGNEEVGGVTARPVTIHMELVSMNKDVREWESPDLNAGVILVPTNEDLTAVSWDGN